MATTVRRVCTKCGKNRGEKFYVSSRGRVCAFCRKRRVVHASREVRLMETHFITLDEYAKLDEVQGGKCYICLRTPRYNKDVDHDHAVERELLRHGHPLPIAHRMSIRGLLCKPCNRRLLPAAGDMPERLLRAVDYLQYPPAYHVLRNTQGHLSP